MGACGGGSMKSEKSNSSNPDQWRKMEKTTAKQQGAEMCLYLYNIKPNVLGTFMGRILRGLNSIHDLCKGHLACCAQCPHYRLRVGPWISKVGLGCHNER